MLLRDVINLVPLLHERGYSGPAASWVLGIGGIGQVVGRLGNAALARRTRLATRTVAVFAASAVTTALFAAVPAPYVLLVAVSLLASNARGLSTLLAATAVSDRWGVARYARLNGMFNAHDGQASAIAPFIGAGLADAGRAGVARAGDGRPAVRLPERSPRAPMPSPPPLP